MNLPFIYTTDNVSITRAVGFDNQNGVKYEETDGEHSIWAARIPFLPAMTSGDFTRMGGQSRIPYIQARQVRFLYDLVRSRENQATFDLRFISTPNPIEGQPNLIDIIFLGKVFSSRQSGSIPLAQRLWDKFVSIFPLEDPFNYPLEPVIMQAEFQRYYDPLGIDNLRNKNILEIRKYEDMPIKNPAPMGRVERKGDYIAHPFVPSVNFNPMGRFLTALADQRQKCYASISLRPTRMYDHEVYNTSFAIGQFKNIAIEDKDVTEEYIRSRSLIGVYVYQQLMAEREQLGMVRVQILGEKDAPYALAEALGSEMMGNIQNEYPTQWVIAQPADENELQTAIHNIKFLEQDMWGDTLASAPLQRLRYLVTPREAYGAFRLPVAPESGYLPGILVKNEPFVAFAEELETQYRARANMDDATQMTKDEASKPKISLGKVYHRGNPTPQLFNIKVEDLVRHILIAGSTGSGKSTTIKYILTQLWQNYKIPFLVLYPIDKPDYRDLLAFPSIRNNLLIFTLGDASTSPFRFNPFEVPDGLLLKTHISRLMRVFMAAFTLQDPLPMIYRDALRKIYQEKGWDIVTGKGDSKSGRQYPVMSEFYAAIKKITDGLEYGKEVKDNVRQASVIRIADLLENAGHVVNVRRSMSFATIMNNPSIMEIGRVGSAQDTSLLMGFLLMRLAEEIERHPRPLTAPHITVVEEAHRLMAEVSPGFGGGDPRSAAGEDFANILAEVRGYGEGLIIAEQMPTMLVKGAIGNTFLKIMHWLEDAPSFDLFGSITNLSPQQREYARTLATGFAIVRSPSGHPVHIKVPESHDQTGYEKIPDFANSDDAIKSFMDRQRQQLGIADMNIIPWDVSLAAKVDSESSSPGSKSESKKTTDPWGVNPNDLAVLMMSPMKTCLYCRPWQKESKCQYAEDARNLIEKNSKTKAKVEAWLEQASMEYSTQKSVAEKTTENLQPLLEEIAKKAKPLKTSSLSGTVYCFYAHAVDEWQHKYPLDDRSRRTVGQRLLSYINKSRASMDSPEV